MFPLTGVASVLTPLAIATPLTIAAPFLVPRWYGVRHEVSRHRVVANAGASFVLLVGTLKWGSSGHVGGSAVWPLYFGMAGSALIFVCTAIVAAQDAQRDVLRAELVRERLPVAEQVAPKLYPYLVDGPAGERLRCRIEEQLAASQDCASRGMGTGAMRALHGAMLALRDGMDPRQSVPPASEARAVHDLIEATWSDIGAGWSGSGSPDERSKSWVVPLSRD